MVFPRTRAMPEIWLNYGSTDVVLDVRAENLGERIDSGGEELGDDRLLEALGGAVPAGGADLVALHDSAAVRRAITALAEAPPRVLADPGTLATLGPALPAGCRTAEFDAGDPGTLAFVSEVEFDGLFGYETVATRLLRRFGAGEMLAAYAGRRGNLPAPGHRAGPLVEAEKFAGRFEITAVELVAGSSGIDDVVAGHPSKTAAAAAAALESRSVREAPPHGTVFVSPGKASGGATLASALRSLWTCAAAVRRGGLAVLVAECGGGLGSEALRQHVEGRLPPGQLRSPSRYVDGMEGLLYLSEAAGGFQTGLVSVLPEFYAKRLGLVPLPGAAGAMEYALGARGAREKVAVVGDGARLLLR